MKLVSNIRHLCNSPTFAFWATYLSLLGSIQGLDAGATSFSFYLRDLATLPFSSSLRHDEEKLDTSFSRKGKKGLLFKQLLKRNCVQK